MLRRFFRQPAPLIVAVVPVVVIAICMGLFGAGLAGQLREAVAPDSRGVVVQRLQVGLVQAIPISKPELDTVRDQLTRIWQPEGILIELITSGPPAPGLRILLTEDPIHVPAARSSLCTLGAIRFVNSTPEPELTVSVTAAREFVRQARPEWSFALRSLIAARIVGRVAAHEIGHYLLAESGHRSRGLMRARFDGADLLAPHLKPFAPPHRADLEAGLTRAIKDATR